MLDINELLIECYEMVESEFKDLEKNYLITLIMELIEGNIKEFKKLNYESKFDFLIDGLIMLIEECEKEEIKTYKNEWLVA